MSNLSYHREFNKMKTNKNVNDVEQLNTSNKVKCFICHIICMQKPCSYNL